MPVETSDPRQQVIDAADALFYAQSVRAVGMDDVPVASGVSLKRLYSLFPGKDALDRHFRALRAVHNPGDVKSRG